MRQSLARAWAIAKKDIRIYYLKGPVVIFGLLLPLFLYLAYAMGRSMAPEEAVSSIMTMTVFFTSTAVGPVIAPWETRSRTFERLVSAPVSMADILLGDAVASIIFGVLITAAVALFGTLVGVSIANPALLAYNLLASSFCFSFLGLLLSSPPADTPANIMMLSSLLKFPMIFISGVFIPLSQMPEPARAVALISPLTYTAELSRQAVYAQTTIPTPIAAAVLILYAVFFAAAAIKLHERSVPKRL